MMITDQIAADRRSSARSDHLRPDIAEVRSTVTDLEQRARTFIGQRPVVAVLAAAGVGYLVARLVARGMK